jgi:LacI family transcriptional regulator, galactose operon repressor
MTRLILGETVGIVRVKRQETPHGNVRLAMCAEPLDGVLAHVRAIGWSLLVTYWDGVSVAGASRMDAMPGKVDGILIDEGGFSFPGPLLARLAARVPVVIIGGPPDERGYDVVTADAAAGAASVATHLITEHGSRRFFHVGGPAGEQGPSQCLTALERVLRDHPDARLVGTMQGPLGAELGERAAARVLTATGGQLPDAIVCASDQAAAGLLRALARAGVRVPADVAVAGFDGECRGRPAGPLLTMAGQPRRLFGRRACARLIERIEAPGLPPAVETLPGELVIGASCGCPAGMPSRAVSP